MTDFALFKLCLTGLEAVPVHQSRALKLAKVLELAKQDNFAFIDIDCEPDIDIPILCNKVNNILTSRVLHPIELHIIFALAQDGVWLLRHGLYDSQGNVRLLSSTEELAAVYGKPYVLHLLNYSGRWQEILFEGHAEPTKELSEILTAVTHILQRDGDSARIFQDLSCVDLLPVMLWTKDGRKELMDLCHSLFQTEPGNFIGYIELIQLAGVAKERLDRLKELLASNLEQCKKVSAIEWCRTLEEVITNIERLGLTGGNVIWARLFNFIKRMLAGDQKDSRIKDRRLYGSLLLVDQELTRSFRRLKAKLHPDNVVKYAVYGWKLPEHKKAEGYALLTQLSQQLAEDMLLKSRNLDLQQQGLYRMEESNAQYFWLLGQETLSNYNKYLRALKPQDCHIAEFKRRMESQFGLAKRSYRICCLIEDQEDNLDQQVELRQKIAYCYAYSGKVLEAQLYVLSSMLLLEGRLYCLKHPTAPQRDNWENHFHQELLQQTSVIERLHGELGNHRQHEKTVSIKRDRWIKDERALRIAMERYKSAELTLLTAQDGEDLSQRLDETNLKIAEITPQVAELSAKIEELSHKISHKSAMELDLANQLTVIQETIAKFDQQINDAMEKIKQVKCAIEQEIIRLTAKLKRTKDLLPVIKNISEQISQGVTTAAEDQQSLDGSADCKNGRSQIEVLGVEVVTSSDTLVHYQIPESCIQSAIENRDKYAQERDYHHFCAQAAHIGSYVVGAGSLFGGISLACLGLFSGGSLLLISGILVGMGGVLKCAPYLERKSLDKAKEAAEMAEKIKVWQQLNDITHQAYSKYKAGDYPGFLVALSAVYEVNGQKKQLLNVNQFPPNHLWMSPEENFMTPLKEHGFRPDAIAYLILIFGEVMLKYDPYGIKQGVYVNNEFGEQQFPADYYPWTYIDRLSFAGDIWSVLSGAMKLLAPDLSKWRDDLLRSQHGKRVLAAEHIADAMELPFKARLYELHNLAQINVAMVSALLALAEHCESEVSLTRRENFIKKGFFWYNQARAQVSRGDYLIWYRQERLEALEDLLLALNVSDGVMGDRLQLPASAKPLHKASSVVSERTALLSDEQQNKISYVNNIKQAEQCKQAAECKERELGYIKQDIINDLEHAVLSYQVSLDIYAQEEDCNFNAIAGLLLLEPKLILHYGSCLLKLLRYEELESWLMSNSKLLQLQNLAESHEFKPQELEKLQNIVSDYLILQSMLKRKINKHKEARDSLLIALDVKAENKLALQEYQIVDGIKIRKDKRLMQQNNQQENADSYASIASSEGGRYKILALDGGGFFAGMPQAYMLNEIEKRLHRPISSIFNTVVALGSSGWMASGLLLPATAQASRPLYRAEDMVWM